VEDFIKLFDEIRPYNETEAQDAFKRIASAELLPRIVSTVFPSKDVAEVQALLLNLSSIDDFQSKVMIPALTTVLNMTTAGITYSGVDNIKDGKTHIFLSGHRDIILDPAILEFILYHNGVPWSEIAVGDNLLGSSLIKDLMFTNRMIKVIRSGNTRDKYIASTVLSEYLRHKVVGGQRSVWIAHRGGRTKDGNDVTGQGVLKMLSMSYGKDFDKAYKEMSIIPLSVSYEFESCDFLKARELYMSKRGPYVKAAGEDMNSMLTGIMQPKGRVHFHFAPVVSDMEIENCEGVHVNERITSLRLKIDRTIQQNFKLWPNNYIASDIINASDTYSDEYTEEQKVFFIDYMNRGLAGIVGEDKSIDLSELKDIFLRIYANPVFNKEILNSRI